MSQNIESISEFLLHAGTQYLVFDMGRGLRSINSQAFLAIENGEQSAPYPRQQHFWGSIVYWNKQLSTQRYVWFLKLPLDEEGKVVDAARQHFLELVVTALAESSSEQAVDLSKTEQNTGNPYIFTPNQQQLADFNSHTRQQLGLSESVEYSPAKAYLSAPHVLDWQSVGLQGLADAVAFATSSDLLQMLSDCTQKYPPVVLNHLLSSCENRVISEEVENELLHQLHKYGSTNQQFNLLLLRALAQMPSNDKRKMLVKAQLDDSSKVDKDTLIVIAARHWLALEQDNIQLFLEAAARVDDDTNGFNFFAGLFADIAQIPSIRQFAIEALRKPDRSEKLSLAIGALFKQNGK